MARLSGADYDLQDVPVEEYFPNMAHVLDQTHDGDESNMSPLETLLHAYYRNLRENNREIADETLDEIRLYILRNGCQDEAWEEKIKLEQAHLGEDDIKDTVRGKIWKLLLGVSKLDAEVYIEVVETQEKAFDYHLIRKDSKRTCLTHSGYKDRVPEKVLVRLLNTYCLHDQCPGYVQAMNCCAGALLYAMPELDAYHCFHKLCVQLCPTYWNKEYSIVGAYAGALLVHDCIKVCDEELFSSLELIHPWTYAFPAVTSLYTVAPPLDELVKLWDFIFSFGIHVIILCVTAQVINERNLVFEPDAKGTRSSRRWSPINASEIIQTVLRILPSIKAETELWENIRMHTVDVRLATRIKEQGAKKILSKSTKTHKRFESKSVIGHL